MSTPANLILAKYDGTIAARGFKLRAFLLLHLKDILEQPDTAANIIAYSYGRGYKDVLCVIIPSKKGIKLGFNRGAELPDPAHLLTGTGKVHRYVEIKLDTDIEIPALLALLNEALKAHAIRTKKAVQ